MRKTPPLSCPSVPKKMALCTTGPMNDTTDCALCTNPYTVPAAGSKIGMQA